MCGRFLLDADFDELYRKFILHEYDPLEIRRGDILPTEAAPVIVTREGRPVLRLMGWGLSGYQRNQRLINARSETLLQKNRFSRLMDTQRCIVPATVFYEWEKQGRQKLRHTFGGSEILAFAGLYESTSAGESFAIITMESEGDIARIHDRMPLALTDSAVSQWISREVSAEEAYKELMAQKPHYAMRDETPQLTFL